MKSSSGEHYIALDHVRAVAVYMVFAWHFLHANGFPGSPVPYKYAPAVFPLALLDEGYTGVALFMTLSGYLFAKLLDGKRIRYGWFVWNRVLRLLPLLAVALLLTGIQVFSRGDSVATYISYIAWGALLPSLPNGAWSITVEFHFYLVLPLFLWMLRRSRWLPITIVALALAARTLIFLDRGGVQAYAYYTIVGRIDQFTLGMILFQFRSAFARRHLLSIGCLLAFSLFYWVFDLRGGFYHNPSYPSTNPIWIVLPTIEGLAYAVAIAWYDSSFSPSNRGVSGFVGRIGSYSYSIYLLHFFVVFQAARFVSEYVMNISNFYLACLWSFGCFLLMMPIGYLSFRFIEAPFLAFRKRYTLPAPAA